MIVLLGMDLQQALVDLLARGAYIPALAVVLVLATHALRRRGVDVTLAHLLGHADPGTVRKLRPWLPLGMAAVACLLASGSGAMDVARAAAESLAAAVLAMAGHNTGQAVLALKRAPQEPPASGPGDDDEPEPQRPSAEPRQRPERRSIQRRLLIAERVVVALGSVLFVAVTAGCEGLELAGHPAAGIEIVVEKDAHGRTLARGDAVYLHELPIGGGFYEAAYSRLYRGPLPAAGQEEYGATEAMRPSVFSALAVQHVDALTGITFGEIQIPNAGALYETLWWMLFAGAEYPAVLFDPLPGQPTPPSGMPITTYLLLCNTDEPDSRNCRSWPGAVNRGMAVCRDVATKTPISKSKCTFLAPYTQWWVRGTPPANPVAPALRYAEAMAATKAQELLEHFTREAAEQAASLPQDERREAEEWAARVRAASEDKPPDKRWSY